MSEDDACTTYLADHQGGALLVLGHGAGAGQHHPFMVASARGLAARGIDVVTFDFPYMRDRRKVPDKAPVLEAEFRRVVHTARDHPLFRGHRLLIGGKSMGGRMATHLASQGLEHLAGVVALGYPLHPPGQPLKLRTEHLPAISVPVLIVQGERDTFGTPDELRTAIDTMTAPVTLHVVAKGDHSLAVRGQSKDDVMNAWLDVAAAWILKIHSVYG
jgi:predicted alpha/beta-hydrolase family hydrolase